MNLFHWVFDKCYPLIRFVHEIAKNNDWFTEITPQLWLSGAPTYERDYQRILDEKITAVVNIRAEREDDLAFYAKHEIDYIQLKVFDMIVPPDDILDEGTAWIHDKVNEGKVVDVHCAKGRGRSATLLAAYLMKHHDMDFDQAYHEMKSRRSLTKLEPRHEKALRAWKNNLVD